MLLNKIRIYFRTTAIIAVLGIAGFYGGRLIFSEHQDVSLQSASSNSVVSARDVPETVVKQITNEVAGVKGIDQMVVLPAENGSGYSVTAQIDFGSQTASKAELSDEIQVDVSKFFKQIFSNEQEVTDAAVYFIADGQIVASAGLGTKAYHELAAKAGVAPYNLAVSLETMPSVSGQGVNNSWFEFGMME